MEGIIVGLLQLFVFVLIARAILSWIPIGYDSPLRPVVDLVVRITEPVLAPVRGVLPPLGGLDLSPLVVLLGIQILLVPLVRSIL